MASKLFPTPLIKDQDQLGRAEGLVAMLANTPESDFCPNVMHGDRCAAPCARFRLMVAEAQAIIDGKPAVA